MQRIRFYVNTVKTDAASIRQRLSAMASAHGLIGVEDGTAEAIIALGGDGTILRAVHQFPDLPILGFNLGGLGYLASVEEREFEHALSCLADDEYSISSRRLVEAEGGFAALNDIVVMREGSGHSVRLDLEADGKLVTRYMVDGLIFATPTGSTAYSLAAGGPVLMPDSNCFVVTPINPHALGVRPLVVDDSVRFNVTARDRTEDGVGVYADGEKVKSLVNGETITIKKSLRTAKLIALNGYDPYEVLARKLGWSGSNVR